MGNEAIALGAIAAGVNLAAGYPGTPSTEVLETIAKRRPDDLYVEWSVNEKTAMELAAGASYAGARVLLTMKQMGLNVAADPLMCLEYIGARGGIVVLVADDPGPISSQTEQDTRHFASFSKVPCLDPSTPREAYEMTQFAFRLSEEYGTPVFLRSTTRVSHAYASIDVKDEDEYEKNRPDGFHKDPGRYVIFPKLSYANHRKIEERNALLSDVFSDYEGNRIYPSPDPTCQKGIASGGISFTYVMEAAGELQEAYGNAGSARLLKVSTPFPFPEKKALEFLDGLQEVLCIEELDPVIERELTYIAGKHGLKVRILGKLTGNIPSSGENDRDTVKNAMADFLGLQADTAADIKACDENPISPPPLPVRPPVLCAGCPHRASFYAVKKAMQGKKSVFCGDIGCYTLGNAAPLNMVDTCLCMGAGLGIAQGIFHTEPDTHCFAFVGDSTFFASAIPGVVNAIYNKAEFTLVILDNSTTAMTGHQPHPGTGRTLMGEEAPIVDIEAVLRGIGVSEVECCNPMDHKKSVETVRQMAGKPGVKAIIFRYPCIALMKPGKSKGVFKQQSLTIDADKCTGCLHCVREIGCPALVPVSGESRTPRDNGEETRTAAPIPSREHTGNEGNIQKQKKVTIDASLCTGCGLCGQICPSNAIVSHKDLPAG